MPKYGYKCKQCGHQFDARQRMSDDPLTECPVCGGELRRVVGSVGIVFKGKGFYVTDHRNGSGRVQTPDKSEKSSDAKDNSDKPKKKDSGSDKAKSSAAASAASAPS